MQKALLYIFLFTYSTVMFKPVMPFVTDAVAHLLFYKNHMLNMHAHHGKYHVHAAITEAAKNDQSDKSTSNLKKENQASEHIFYTISQAPLFTMLPQHFNHASFPIINMSIAHDYPPPRA